MAPVTNRTTRAIGRYLYAWIPRAANGRELELAEVKGRLSRDRAEWDGQPSRFRQRVRDELFGLLEQERWSGSFVGRLTALLVGRSEVRRLLRRLRREAREEGVSEEEITETIGLARRAQRTALMAAHFEDLRALLGSWRWLHRWVAALLVVLIAIHIVYAVTYGSFLAEAAG